MYSHLSGLCPPRMYQYSGETTADPHYTGDTWASSNSNSSGIYGMPLPDIRGGGSGWPGIGGWMQVVERLCYLSHHNKSASRNSQIAELRQQIQRRLEEQQMVLEQLGRWIQDTNGQLHMLTTLLQTIAPAPMVDESRYPPAHKHSTSTASTSESSKTAHMERKEEIGELGDLLAGDPLDYTIGLHAWQQALQRNQQAQVKQQRQPFRFNPQPVRSVSSPLDTIRNSRKATTIALRAPCVRKQESREAVNGAETDPCVDVGGRRGVTLSIRGIMKPHHSYSSSVRQPLSSGLASASSESSSSSCSTFLCDAEDLLPDTRNVSNSLLTAASVVKRADVSPAAIHMTLPKVPSPSIRFSVADSASTHTNNSLSSATPPTSTILPTPAMLPAPVISPTDSNSQALFIPPAPAIPSGLAILPTQTIPQTLTNPPAHSIPPASTIPPAPAIPSDLTILPTQTIPPAPVIPPTLTNPPAPSIPSAPAFPPALAIPPAPSIPSALANPSVSSIPSAPPAPSLPVTLSGPPAPSLPAAQAAPPLRVSPTSKTASPILPAPSVHTPIACTRLSSGVAALHCGSKQQHLHGAAADKSEDGAHGIGRPKLGVARATCPACAGLSKRTTVALNDTATSATTTDGTPAKSVLELARMFDMRGI
ncbi:hypothetical protein COEREDRAFT_99996 [Coemansia reversa NRRL 1564]|uniref:Uncharacterized protein n=1 Tax=Coemansia reversa (strain ATCC 12441 / NRRL 1564) TaxID=763665 RepID=A0A2G5B0X6_COERN|nr:hypothetical protein COEREDRAFT_99996 [Coemansia reversa NRRL 1564]|eukprot:PIA12660.1 hypothetical protein COEREDRAFT_99996 [Coemansia reversa NRRL 1564]